jgi:hypothetical protein
MQIRCLFAFVFADCLSKRKLLKLVLQTLTFFFVSYPDISGAAFSAERRHFNIESQAIICTNFSTLLYYNLYNIRCYFKGIITPYPYDHICI